MEIFFLPAAVIYFLLLHFSLSPKHHLWQCSTSSNPLKKKKLKKFAIYLFIYFQPTLNLNSIAVSTEWVLAQVPNLFHGATWPAFIFFWRVKQRKNCFLLAFTFLITGEAPTRHSMMREDCYLLSELMTQHAHFLVLAHRGFGRISRIAGEKKPICCISNVVRLLGVDKSSLSFSLTDCFSFV